MEPMVVFGAFLVVFCGYVALMDALRDLGRGRAAVVAREAAAMRRRRHAVRRPIFSASHRGGGGVARWQAPLRGSV